MVRWRSGLTHMPFTHALTGSNPVRATILKNKRLDGLFFFFDEDIFENEKNICLFSTSYLLDY